MRDPRKRGRQSAALLGSECRMPQGPTNCRQGTERAFEAVRLQALASRATCRAQEDGGSTAWCSSRTRTIEDGRERNPKTSRLWKSSRVRTRGIHGLDTARRRKVHRELIPPRAQSLPSLHPGFLEDKIWNHDLFDDLGLRSSQRFRDVTQYTLLVYATNLMCASLLSQPCPRRLCCPRHLRGIVCRCRQQLRRARLQLPNPSRERSPRGNRECAPKGVLPAATRACRPVSITPSSSS